MKTVLIKANRLAVQSPDLAAVIISDAKNNTTIAGLYKSLGQPVPSNDSGEFALVLRKGSFAQIAKNSSMFNTVAAQVMCDKAAITGQFMVKCEVGVHKVGENYINQNGEEAKYGYDDFGNLKDNAKDWVDIRVREFIVPEAAKAEFASAIASETAKQLLSGMVNPAPQGSNQYAKQEEHGFASDPASMEEEAAENAQEEKASSGKGSKTGKG